VSHENHIEEITMKRVMFVLCAVLLAAPAFAGVVYEIETKDHTSSPERVFDAEMVVEGRSLKMGVEGGKGGANNDMIFRGDRREMIVVDHDDRTYFVMDEATLKELAAKLNEVTAMMEQAMANVPESQRAMVEKMMKQRMPQQAAPRVASELRKTGDRDTINGYPCVRYELWRGGLRTSELWVTDWSNIEGGPETTEAFQEMSEFFKEMLDSIPQFAGGGGVADTAFEHMKEMNGFPVVTREFADDGSLERMVRLKSATRRTIDPAELEPPPGYKRKDMFKN
jgi:hypothetical protein